MLDVHQKAAAWNKSPGELSFEEKEYIENPSLYEALSSAQGFDLEKLGAIQHQSAWEDVERKASRILKSGGAVLYSKEPADPSNPIGALAITGRVIGDHGVYGAVIEKPTPISATVISWNCGCTWGEYRRPGLPNQNPDYYHVWERYSGRVCSHVLALYWKSQDFRIPVDFSDVPDAIMQKAAPDLTRMGVLKLEDSQRYADMINPIDEIVPDLVPGEEMFADYKGRLDRYLSEREVDRFALTEGIDASFSRILDPTFKIEQQSRGVFDTDATENYKQEIQDRLNQIALIDGASGNGMIIALDDIDRPILSSQLSARVRETSIFSVVEADFSQHEKEYLVPSMKILVDAITDAYGTIDFGQNKQKPKALYEFLTGRKNWEFLTDRERDNELRRWERQRKVLMSFKNNLLEQIHNRRKQIERDYRREALKKSTDEQYYTRWVEAGARERLFWQYYDEYNGTSYAKKFDAEMAENPITAIQNAIALRTEQLPGAEPSKPLYYERTKDVFNEIEQQEDEGFSPEEGPKTSNFSILSSEVPIKDIIVYLQNQIAFGARPPAYVRKEMWGEQRGGLHPHPDAMPINIRQDGNPIYSQDDMGYDPESRTMGNNIEERGTYGAIPIGEEVLIVSVHPKDRLVLIEYELNNPSPNHQHIHLWVPIKDVDLI